MANSSSTPQSPSERPLLQEDRDAIRGNAADDAQDDGHTAARTTLRRHYNWHRQRIQKFLASRTQHYFVLALVSLDLLGIFGDIFINLYTCEEGEPSPTWDQVREGLGIAGLVFSCLFMVELILSLWAFGWRYFQSLFHIMDATVILAGFVVDVLLKGVLEEVASLVVVLRLWRFFKIIEEFSVGAEEQMDGLEARIEMLESENRHLKAQLERGRNSKGSKIYDEETRIS